MTRSMVSLVSFVLAIIFMFGLSGCCGIECQMLNIWKYNDACNAGSASVLDTAQEEEQRDSTDTGNGWDAPDTAEAWNDRETGDTGSWSYSKTADPMSEPSDAPIFMMTTAGNGFVYPLDVVTSWSNTYDYAGYGACGTSYYTNTCHNGTDIGSARGSSVYAIAAGTVVKVSGSQNSTCTSGWGYDYGGASTCNMALAVQHYAADGSAFVVVYGHLVYSSSVAVGTTYSPGDTIGTIAYDYDRTSSTSSWSKTSSPHLHFGVFPGTSSPAVSSGLYGWGKLTCSGANQAASSTLPSSCTNNGSTAPGTYIGAKVWTAPPGAPTLSSPANGASTTSPVSLSWVNSSGTYRTHVMVCTNSSLTTGCINPDGGMTGQEPTTAFTTSYSATLSKVTYYWAVREIAYNDYGGWGSYSTVRSFTVR